MNAALRLLLPHVPLLVALGETSHLTTSAAIAGVSQPSASRTLRRLESQLGFSLVEPSGRGVVLTAAANAIMPHLRRALDAMEDGVAALVAADEHAQRTITVAFQNSLGERLVPALIRRVGEIDPGIRFSLTQGSRRYCLDLLADGRTDLALTSRLDPAPVDANVVHLFDQPLVVAAPSDGALAAAGSIRVVELAQWPLVTLKPGYGLRESTDELLRTAGVMPRIAFEGEDLHTVYGLVAAGLGVAVVVATAEPPAGCVHLPFADVAASRDIGAAYPVHRQAPALWPVLLALQAFSAADV